MRVEESAHHAPEHEHGRNSYHREEHGNHHAADASEFFLTWIQHTVRSLVFFKFLCRIK